jgi:oligopeptide transport system permease protein
MVFFGRKVILIFVGLGLIYWIVLARIVRGQILSFKQREFVLAAKSNGVSEISIIFRHLVPNVLGPVIVFSTLLVPQIMLLEAFLSFIGLGISPPEVSMGILISDGANVISNYAWPILYPGIIFSLVIFCMNFIGDGLRDALDPKSTK